MPAADEPTAATHITDAMRAAVGGQVLRCVSYPVSAMDIRRWALAAYFPDAPPARYVDAAVAPEEFNPFAWLVATRDERVPGVRARDPDYIEIQLGVSPPGLRHQLNGGLEVEYGVAMRPGDVITSAMRLVSYSEREGRLGLMLFHVIEETWTNQAGALVKRLRTTLIRY